MNVADIQRGYVLSDGYNDTHGFRWTSRRAWCRFRPEAWKDAAWHDVMGDGPRLCALWVDCLGDYYVLSPELDHFEKLDGEGVLDYRIEPEGGCQS